MTNPISTLLIKETERSDLDLLRALWNDGDVMRFVGFPQGLGITHEGMTRWFEHLVASRPQTNHYVIYHDDLGFCGETYYRIDDHMNAALDIKLYVSARGQGIASKALSYAIDQAFIHGAKKVYVDPNPKNHKAIELYQRLGFSHLNMPNYLADEIEGLSIDFIPYYMEKSNPQIKGE